MEYIVKQCPKCSGELHIPAEMKKCICMFCGEEFEIQNTEGKDQDAPDRKTVEMAYHNALAEIALLVENCESYMMNFTKDKYGASFEKYLNISRPILKAAEDYVTLFEASRENVIQEISQGIIEAAKTKIDEARKAQKASTRTRIIDQYRFFLAIYTVPMVRYLNYGISEPLADGIIEIWRNQYPKHEFKKGNYDELQAGFKRKGFCFITTAVCESMEKPDDCYELTIFRNFRDTYMQMTRDRQAMVEVYYQIAPAIVAIINTQPNRNRIYSSIWREFLQPCLEDIEENRLEDCEKHYTYMINKLKDEFLYYQ
ncbi:MAG: hypothetical protein GX306_08000 [Clostridiales bacterium]|nr:hypothetical protein [Clostridiales bacterium]